MYKLSKVHTIYWQNLGYISLHVDLPHLYWTTGLKLDWTEILSFLDKFLCLFLERSLNFYNLQVPGYYG